MWSICNKSTCSANKSIWFEWAANSACLSCLHVQVISLLWLLFLVYEQGIPCCWCAAINFWHRHYVNILFKHMHVPDMIHMISWFIWAGIESDCWISNLVNNEKKLSFTLCAWNLLWLEWLAFWGFLLCSLSFFVLFFCPPCYWKETPFS